MGGLLKTISKRLAFLDQLVSSRKIHLSEEGSIYFLVGDRLLWPDELNDGIFLSKKKSLKMFLRPLIYELDLPDFLWSQTNLGPILKKYSYSVLKSEKSSGDRRVRTADTVLDFLRKTNYKSGNILIVSSSPFVMYQGLTTKTLFIKKGFPIDTVDVVGPCTVGKDVTDEKLGRVLDSFARAFYQKFQLEDVQYLERKEG